MSTGWVTHVMAAGFGVELIPLTRSSTQGMVVRGGWPSGWGCGPWAVSGAAVVVVVVMMILLTHGGEGPAGLSGSGWFVVAVAVDHILRRRARPAHREAALFRAPERLRSGVRLLSAAVPWLRPGGPAPCGRPASPPRPSSSLPAWPGCWRRGRWPSWR